MPRTIVVVIMLVLLAATAQAQTPATSFAELGGRLKIGETVIVTADTGETIKGKLDQVTDSMLVLRHKARALPFASIDVQRLARPRHPLRTGALIGLGVGFAVGATMAGTSGCEITCFASPGGILIIGGLFGSIGAGAGTVIGSAFPRENLIYVKPRASQAGLSIAPLMTHERKGIAVSVAF